MTDGIALTLPGGSWSGDCCRREIALRPLRGADEAWLADTADILTPAERTTRLLARCVKRIGDVAPVDREAIRDLTIGDREALMLHLRRLAFGDRMRCIASCPAADCGERLEWKMEIHELVLPPYAHNARFHETTISENDTDFLVRFRLPTGADQEAAADRVADDQQGAMDLILRRCIVHVSTVDDRTLSASDWPVAVREQLPKRMSELDPQAELEIDLVCPVCGNAFSTVLDASAYLFQELIGQEGELYREVHLLAFYYHWSEADIMEMVPRKRRRYLDLLIAALGETEEP